jgi:hypothetical protein
MHHSVGVVPMSWVPIRPILILGPPRYYDYSQDYYYDYYYYDYYYYDYYYYDYYYYDYYYCDY